ncbi:hypothetical protein [Mycobacterium sp.]|uniref:hypothetical protein n=1 Tax=Mycobacterium sp. TaxID=1785 RepID=UPI0012859F59|nr:hypothetical protein [Mycobacterium sp.]KAA8966022.1 MAG: hypothetical protein F6Q13_07885 [Mycobacterium sp.]
MHTVAVMGHRFLCRVIALASLVGFLGIGSIGAAPARSEPADSDTTVVNGPTLSLSDLGYSSTLSFYTLQGAQQLVLPVQQGLTPAAVNATVVPPVNLRSGLITVTQDDREIARLDLPTANLAPIVIPLAGATVTEGAITVTFRAYLVPIEGYCLDYTSPLQLINTTVSYTGVEQPPTAVALFLPPVLRKLTIYVPPSPSAAESDTAIQLAAATAARYGGQTPEISVVGLGEGQDPPATPRLLERSIVVKEGRNSGLSLQGPPGAPWLLISGPLGASAESDLALLFGDLSQLAFAPKVVAGSLQSSVRLPADTATLRELGQPGFTSVALQPRVSIALDQTRFGRSIHSVRVHLLGSYSPTPANLAGQIVATVGAETIDQWSTDGHGVIDRWIDVPDRLLQRYTTVDLALTIAGNTGRCGDFYTAGPGDQLLTLTVNGDSTVQTSPAMPPVPDGLRSVPQALMPKVQVGMEARSLADTVRAAQIVVGLQRVSSLPIATTVTSVKQALESSKPAILIAADGWNHPDIALPVAAGSTGPITLNAIRPDGKPVTLTLDPPMRFGSLQTVVNHGRSLLVATSNGAPAQLDELLNWLGGDPKHWSELRGVAVVSVAGQEPVLVDRPYLGIASQSSTTAHRSDSRWLWWFGGAWLAAAVIGAAVIAVRTGFLRRR